MASKIQTVLFAKAQWTIEKAQSWLRAHDLKAPTPDVTENHLRFRQFDPKTCATGSFKTITENFPAGVSAVVCDLAGKRAERADEDEVEAALVEGEAEAMIVRFASSAEPSELTSEQNDLLRSIMEDLLSPSGVLWEPKHLERWLSQSQQAFFGFFYGSRSPQVTRDRGVAIVNITGPLTNGSGYGLSYGKIVEAVREQVEDTRVKSVLMSFDSPGGVVRGMAEASRELARLGTRKPIYSYAAGTMASAAYALGSAGRKIYVNPTSEIGSIGVVALHADYSKMLAKDGVKPTYIYAGKFKTLGNRYEPLSDDAREMYQGIVDKSYEQLVGLIGENRASLGEEGARNTEAWVYMGRSGVEADLADWVVESQGEVLDVISGMTSTIPNDFNHGNGSSRGERLGAEENMSIENKETGGASPAAPAAQPAAQVVDLEAAREKMEAKAALDAETRVHEIAELCELAGYPEMTSEYVRSKKPLSEIRSELIAKKAKQDETEISGQHAGQPNTTRRLVDHMSSMLASQGLKPRPGTINRV